MTRYKVKALLCENNILESLMSIPVKEILLYSSKADLVDPEDALRYLADMYIDNCGVSTGMRSFADYCADFWIKRLKSKPDLDAKYEGIETLDGSLSLFSENYSEEIDDYDICFMNDTSLRDILLEELESVSDEKTKIILCAGICDILPEMSDNRWLDSYEMEKIEDAIVNLKSVTLMQYRQNKNIAKYYPPFAIDTPEDIPEKFREKIKRRPELFSTEEVCHFKLLNTRLTELQHEVMAQVRDITLNLQEQIANGFHQYDSFNVEGLIYIDDFDSDVDSLLNVLSDHAKYMVMVTNGSKNFSPEHLDELIAMDIHWYGNWSGIFHRLETEHGLRVCRAFCKIFEDSNVFTIDDIMKIKPEMLFSQVKIYI